MGKYVVVEGGSKIWVAFVDHQDKEYGDYHIQFLQSAGIRPSYAFSSNEREQCFKSSEQIIGVLPQPNPISGSRMRYSFPKERLQALIKRSVNGPLIPMACLHRRNASEKMDLFILIQKLCCLN